MAKKKSTSRLMRQPLGAHMSAAGGLENAFYAGRDVGCDCLQIFVKNQRQWSAKPLTDEQIRTYRAAEMETELGPVFAHASYLLNLASPESANREKSCKALVDELERCEALAIRGLVVHPGAHMGDGEDEGIRRISQSLDHVHANTRGFTSKVLLETTAGQGSSIGCEIEQLGDIIDGVKSPERLGVCLDTCHLFAAGYDFRDRLEYEEMIDTLDHYVGFDRIYCIHMNDSKTSCGSRIDRHEHITQGEIGKQGFIHILKDRRLVGVPKILETPKGKNERGMDLDKVNLRRMRSLIRS
ncbi:MAG: deoxyribonuclease IV [Phycisphaerae bacterium]